MAQFEIVFLMSIFEALVVELGSIVSSRVPTLCLSVPGLVKWQH
jgi:hypothetical protein